MQPRAVRLFKHTGQWVLLAGATLFASAGDPPTVWVAFTNVHASKAAGGNASYVDLLVGSDETGTPRVFAMSVDLVASDAKQRVACRATASLTTALRPAAVRPIRVQVMPAAAGSAEETEEYTIAAAATWKTGGEREWSGKSENSTRLEVPRGATVQCLRRP